MNIEDVKKIANNPVVWDIFNKAENEYEESMKNIDSMDIHPDLKEYMKISVDFTKELLNNKLIYGNSKFEEVFEKISKRVLAVDPNIDLAQFKSNVIDSLMEI